MGKIMDLAKDLDVNGVDNDTKGKMQGGALETFDQVNEAVEKVIVEFLTNTDLKILNDQIIDKENIGDPANKNAKTILETIKTEGNLSGKDYNGDTSTNGWQDLFLQWINQKYNRQYNRISDIDNDGSAGEFSDYDLENLRIIMAFREIETILNTKNSLGVLADEIKKNALNGKTVKITASDDKKDVNGSQVYGTEVTFTDEKPEDEGESAETGNDKITVTAPTARELTANGTAQNLLNQGTIEPSDKGYKFVYYAKDEQVWNDKIPARVLPDNYEVERKIVDSEGNDVSEEAVKDGKSSGKVPVTIKEKGDSGASGVEDENINSGRIVQKYYEKTDDDTNGDTEKGSRKLKRASKKINKAMKKAMKKGMKLNENEEGDVVIAKDQDTNINEGKRKKVAKKLNKAQDLINRARVYDMEKVRDGKVADLIETYTGVTDIPKIKNFVGKFKTIFTGKLDSDPIDIEDTIKNEDKHTKKRAENMKNLGKDNLKKIYEFVSRFNDDAELVNGLSDKAQRSDNSINALADYDNSGSNITTVKYKSKLKYKVDESGDIVKDKKLKSKGKSAERTFGGSLELAGSEGELKEAFKDVFTLSENLESFTDGTETVHAIRVMVIKFFLEDGVEDYKFSEIKDAFFKEDVTDQKIMEACEAYEDPEDFDDDINDIFKDPLKLEDLNTFLSSNPEFYRIYQSKIQKYTSMGYELREVVRGNFGTEALRNDMAYAVESARAEDQEAATKIYYALFADGSDPAIPAYDTLGGTGGEAKKSAVFIGGQILDSILGYFAAIDVKDINLSVTANEEQKAQYRQLMKLKDKLDTHKQEGKTLDYAQLYKDLKDDFKAFSKGFTSIFHELKDINSNTDANSIGNKIFSIWKSILKKDFGINIVGRRCKYKGYVNKNKVSNQDIYSGNGLKNFYLSGSLDIGFTFKGDDQTWGVKIKGGLGFENDRMAGLDLNFAKAAENAFNISKKLSEGFDDLSRNDVTLDKIKELLDTNCQKFLNENTDPFWKNNAANFRALILNDLPGLLKPILKDMKENSTTFNAAEFQKVINNILQGILTQIKVGEMKYLNRKTKIERGGISLGFDLHDIWGTVKKYLTVGVNVNFRSYAMKHFASAARMRYMDNELLEGPETMNDKDLQAEDLTDLCKKLRKEIGLQAVEVSEWTEGDGGNKKSYICISAKEAGKQLHDFVNIYDNGAKNRKYEGGKLYIGKDVVPNILKQRYFDVQGTYLFLTDPNKSDSKPGVNHSAQENGIPIKADYSKEGNDSIEGLSESLIVKLTKENLENRFNDESVQDIRESIKDDIKEDGLTLKHEDKDLKGKTLQITKNDPLKVEVVNDTDGNPDNIDIKIIDPTQDAVPENIPLPTLFERPTRETIGFPETMDILEKEDWDGHFKYLKMRMSALASTTGNRNLYDEYLSNINEGEYPEAIANLQTGISDILTNAFPTGSTTQILTRDYKLQNGNRESYTLEKDLFRTLQTALQNANNTVDTKILVDLVTEKLAYEPLIHDVENGVYGVGWLRKLRAETRKQYYTTVDGYNASILTYEKTRKQLEPNFQNSNLSNLLDDQKQIKMENGDPGLYVTCNYHRGVQPVYGQTFGNKIYGGKENGSLTFTPGSPEEQKAGKFLSKERDKNNSLYLQYVEKIAKAIDSSWTKQNIIDQITDGGNVFFDKDGKKRESLTFTVGDIDYTINLEKSEVRFCLVGTCANETFAFIPGDISATKTSRKGRETNFSYGEAGVQGYQLTVKQGGTSVNAQAGMRYVDIDVSVEKRMAVGEKDEKEKVGKPDSNNGGNNDGETETRESSPSNNGGNNDGETENPESSDS